MIIIYHKNNQVSIVYDTHKNQQINKESENITEALFTLALKNPTVVIIWCNEENKGFINVDFIIEEFSINHKMLSYSVNNYISDRIGYVDASPFINVNKNVKYPTWQMSSICGAVHSQTILQFEPYVHSNADFTYNLNQISKLGMPHGLLCYSTPEILLDKAPLQIESQMSISELFQFVKQNYKWVWVFLLTINILIYENRLFLLPLFRSFFFKRNIVTVPIKIYYNHPVVNASYDVIIPTMGRVNYLYDVLKDLRNQLLLPFKVIIVEQNEMLESTSELHYLHTESWPFIIKHKFIHKTGACNARNLAMNFIESDYVFLADDDIRFEENAISNCLNFMHANEFRAVTLSCKRNNEPELITTPKQWDAFGSGCSIVKKEALGKVEFNLAFEHGYGEDSDFGIQLRNSGADVIYMPQVILRHLKAPVGGFRTVFKHPWSKEEIQPKPAPTIMLFKLMNDTKQQLLGYKTLLFIKYYKRQQTRNPFTYFNHFKKQWEVSMRWANQLKGEVN